MTIAARATTRRRHGLRLSLADVARIRSGIESLPVRKIRRVPGLKAERADIILAGVLVIEEVLALGGYPALTVCTRGVRDGVLLREARTVEATR
jgi:exopolyphosphatase/guanosine-5'-triphosphate,3'-diphosphate pyrophosphatase